MRALVFEPPRPHRNDAVALRCAGRAAEYGGGSRGDIAAISPSASISLVMMEGTAMEGTAAAEATARLR